MAIGPTCPRNCKPEGTAGTRLETQAGLRLLEQLLLVLLCLLRCRGQQGALRQETGCFAVVRPTSEGRRTHERGWPGAETRRLQEEGSWAIRGRSPRGGREPMSKAALGAGPGHRATQPPSPTSPVPRVRSSRPSRSCSKRHVPSHRPWASATMPHPGLCMPSTSCSSGTTVQMVRPPPTPPVIQTTPSPLSQSRSSSPPPAGAPRGQRGRPRFPASVGQGPSGCTLPHVRREVWSGGCTTKGWRSPGQSTGRKGGGLRCQGEAQNERALCPEAPAARAQPTLPGVRCPCSCAVREAGDAATDPGGELQPGLRASLQVPPDLLQRRLQHPVPGRAQQLPRQPPGLGARGSC